MKDSLYHSLLRVSALTVAIVLLFESGVLSPTTKQLAQNTHSYIASAIGVSASVTPTELNKLTANITTRERDLDAREAALKEREIAINLDSTTGASSSNTAIYILSAILAILLVLIIINYILDYLRRSKQLNNNYEQMA